jgi:hypothetical protein
MIHHCWFALLLALFAATSPSPANHPFHICVGEMDWDEERGCWEIALRLHAEDIQREMAKIDGKEVELQPGERPPALEKLLEAHFFITQSLVDQKPDQRSLEPETKGLDASKQAEGTAGNIRLQGTKVSRLELVGTESSRGWFWVYFRLHESKQEIPEGSSSAKVDLVRFLHHTILLDQVEGQSNTLLVRTGKQRKSLTFQADSKRSPWPVFDQASK